MGKETVKVYIATISRLQEFHTFGVSMVYMGWDKHFVYQVTFKTIARLLLKCFFR